MKRITKPFPPITAGLLPFFEEGKSAAAAGLTIDDCRHVRQDRRSAWLSGFHKGQSLVELLEASTPEQAAAALLRPADLRALLTPPDEPPAEGWALAGGAWHYQRGERQMCGGIATASPDRLRSHEAVPNAERCPSCRWWLYWEWLGKPIGVILPMEDEIPAGPPFPEE